ncbi:MAG: GNAT family N-acetyltransferase [Tetrasphaera sp.]|nr:GNAT family N-acetyltransferase [Tetrasphaera sp.]
MRTSPWPMTVGDVLLREATAEDIETLLTFRNDPQVNRFMIRTSVDPDQFRADWRAIPESDTDYSCVAELASEVVAMGFLELIDGLGQPGLPERTQARIGYIVAPWAAGHGVGSSVARGLVTAAFDRLGVRRVIAACNADNPASARILEKAGMRREQQGRQDSWHAELGWVDGYEYGLLAEEWRSPSLGTGATLRVEIVAADLEVSLAFYQALGFTLTSRSAGYASVRFGEVRLGLAAAEAVDPVCRAVPAGTELVVEVRDVTSLRDAFVANGIRLAEGLRERPWGLTDVRVTDPDGYSWRFTNRR